MTRRLPLRVLARQMRLPGLPIWRWNFNASGTRLICVICGRRIGRQLDGVHLAIWHPGEDKAKMKMPQNST